jgi:nucleoside 2-deoxyribosyltransferase
MQEQMSHSRTDIEECDMFVTVMSRGYFEDPGRLKELDYAIELGKDIFIIRDVEVEIPERYTRTMQVKKHVTYENQVQLAQCMVALTNGVSPEGSFTGSGGDDDPLVSAITELHRSKVSE